MYYNELYHHGRLGQKWGKKNGPPYPLSRGAVQKAYGRKRGLSGYLQARREKKELKRISEEEKKASERRKVEEEENVRRNSAKEKALKEGRATDLIPYIHELDVKEIQDALKRIEWETKLFEQAAKETESERGWATVNAVMKKVGDVKDWTRTGVDLWKNIDDAIKLLNGEGDKVQGGGGKKKK